jgi:thioredoxin reductase (NADPH)
MSRPDRPAFLVVDDDSTAVAALEQALSRRFGADYETIRTCSPEHGLAVLDRLRGERDVAIMIADLWMPSMTGPEFLVRAHMLHPAARRALIADAFDYAAREPILQAMALGRIDTWLVKPWEPADHHLYLRVSELLDEWVQATEQPGIAAMRIVADPRAPRTHELREVLDRNGIPVVFFPPDSPEGRQLLDRAGEDGTRLPVIVYFNCVVQVDPPNPEIASALGVATRPKARHYDIAVVGGGPAGMSAAVCSASEGQRTLLLEPRSLGGQASSTSMIRNYLGFPRGISGRQLTVLAADQAAMFGPELVYDGATRLDAEGPERLITLASGAQVSSAAVVICVGAEYHRLVAPGVEELLGAGVFYGGVVSEAPAVRGQPVYVVGGGNSAGQAAVYLAGYTDRVSLVVHGSSLVTTMSDYLIQQVEAAHREHRAHRAGTRSCSVHPHRRPAEQRLARRHARQRRQRFPAHRRGPAHRAHTAVPGDQHSRSVRGRRCTPWFGQAGGVGGRGRRERGPDGSAVPQRTEADEVGLSRANCRFGTPWLGKRGGDVLAQPERPR